MKGQLIVAAVAAALITGNAAIAQSPDGQKCQTHVNTDKGDGGVQVYSCKDGEGGITVGGPIKDVDVQHPLGGHNAFFPKAGRDINDGAIAVGKGVEHLGQEIGKLFHW
jgi:hypothetical protein